jgi:rare lipoprotein A
MSFISRSSSSCLGFGANGPLPQRRQVSFADVGKALRLLAVAFATVTLAACAQSSLMTDKAGSLVSNRQSSLESRTKVSSVGNRRVAFFAHRHASPASRRQPPEPQTTSHGIASSYAEDSETASGERFDAGELTAAHRTLPFGTRVRVTNHSNGRSVVVTINDRGPFVHGRVIDVTPAAAHVLGMSGLAPVTVERE